MKNSLTPSSAAVAPNTLDISNWVAEQSLKDQENGVRSPFIEVENEFFHVADSAIGSVVSKLRLDWDEEGKIVPRINPFAVSLSEMQLVLNKRKLELDTNEIPKRKSVGMSR